MQYYSKSVLACSSVYFEIYTVLKPCVMGSVSCYYTCHINFVILYAYLVNLCTKNSTFSFHNVIYNF